MSPEHEERGPAPADEEYEDAEYADEVPRSVFATTWFRAILVVVVLAVVGVLALPYLLDWVSPTRLSPTVTAPVLSVPSPPRGAATPPTGTPPAPPASPAASPPSGPLTAQPAPGSMGSEPRAESPAPSAVGPPRTTSESATPPPAAVKPRKAVEPSKPESAKAAVADSSRARAPRLAPAESSAKPARPVEAPRAEGAGSPGVRKASPAKPRAQAEAGARPGGPYWVQVGAFREEQRARALVAKLRAENFPAGEVTASDLPDAAGAAQPPPREPVRVSDRYDVFVSGASPADVNAKLAGKGLSADPVAGGAVIKPSLPLREAVALSKDLATEEGLRVQVRRATGGTLTEPPAAPRASNGEALYRVRVGGFPSRSAAEQARKALGARGYSGFIARAGG